MGRFHARCPFALALTLALHGCAHRAPPPPSAVAAAPSIELSVAPAVFHEPTQEVTGTGWTLTLPERFAEEDAPAPTRLFAHSTATRLDALTVNVSSAPLSGSFADFLREVSAAHAADGMEVSTPRRLRLGETEVAELNVRPGSNALSLRVFVRAETAGAFAAVVTCTTTARNLGAAGPLCESVRQSLRVGTDFPTAPPTVVGRRWVGAAGRWMSLPLEWIDQAVAPPQVAVARSPYDDGDAVSAVLLGPESVPRPQQFVREVEWSMSSGATIEHRREETTARGVALSFEAVQERRNDGAVFRQRFAARGGRVVIVTCGGRSMVYAQRQAECETILRALQLAP